MTKIRPFNFCPNCCTVADERGNCNCQIYIKNVLPNFKTSIVYKTVKKGQSSFRITQQLIQSIYNKAGKLKNLATLILTIPANQKENYVLTCQIKKEKK